MPNTNGLTSIAPVFYTGDPASNLWLEKGASSASFNSPVVIESDNKSQSAIITVSNTGQLDITASNDITITPGVGDTLSLGNGFVSIPNQAGTQTTTVETDVDGNTTIESQGDVTIGLYTGHDLKIIKSGGPAGIVYDTQYNPIPYPAIQVLSALASGEIAFNQTITVVAGGVYQLQLSIGNLTPVSGTYLYVKAMNGANTITYSEASLAFNASVPTAGAQLVSNYFTAPTTSMIVIVSSSGANWSGNSALQLVRVK